MDSMYKIVTHPGSAHKDDFLSVCVLLATLDKAVVYRREATPADLEDLNTYVVDVGMEHNPLRHNFDHHHDRSLPCAFHLVMRHLGLHEAATQSFVWYPYISMMDVRGPYQAAKYLGVDSSVLLAASSPIDGYLLSIFAAAKTLGSRNLLYKFMKGLGTDMLALIDRKMARLKRLQNEAQVLPVKHLKAVFSTIREYPKLAMELYLGALDDDNIAISITPSNRGEGWELLRLVDHPLVDFRAIADCAEISFVHNNGFLAKTRSRIPIEEVLPLVCRAIADQAVAGQKA